MAYTVVVSICVSDFHWLLFRCHTMVEKSVNSSHTTWHSGDHADSGERVAVAGHNGSGLRDY